MSVLVVCVLLCGMASGAVLRVTGATQRIDDPFAAQLDTSSLSCPQSGFCVAVGTNGAKVLRDGVWRSSPIPEGPWTQVSCASQSYCVAVDGQSRVARFDGRRWFGMEGLSVAVVSLSCAPGTQFCVIGGDGRIYSSSGGAWTRLAFNDVVPAGSHQPEPYVIPVTSVACVSSAFCLAIDQFGTAFAIEHGTVSTANVGELASSAGVSCATQAFCLAVGPIEGGRSVTEIDNDGKWTPGRPIPSLTNVSGVSCPTVDVCEFVGSTPESDQEVIAYDHGSWGQPVTLLDASPGFPGTGGEVSCATPTFCVTAVNHLFATLDGTTWTLPTALGGDVYGLSCVTASRCWAVDSTGRAISYQDDRWSAPFAIDGVYDALQAISCAGALCIAVDDQGNAVGRLNGRWRAPTAIASNGTLTSVSCVAARVCFAGAAGGRVYRYAAGRWNAGTRILNARGTAILVSCSTATFCAAVDSTGTARILLNGRWRRPIRLSRSTATSVSCTTHQFCVALANGQAHEYFSGRWHPAHAVPGSDPFRVSCTAPGTCAFTDSAGHVVALTHGGFSKPLRIGSAQTLRVAFSCAGDGCIAVDQSDNATRLQLTTQQTRRHPRGASSQSLPLTRRQ